MTYYNYLFYFTLPEVYLILFQLLLIVPAIVSSTFLSMGTTFILGAISMSFLFLLTIFHYPLPGLHEYGITFPKFYLIGFFTAILIELDFFKLFWHPFCW